MWITAWTDAYDRATCEYRDHYVIVETEEQAREAYAKALEADCYCACFAPIKHGTDWAGPAETEILSGGY